MACENGISLIVMPAIYKSVCSARRLLLLLMLLGAASALYGLDHVPVVADSATRSSLPGASVFDNRGNIIGLCKAAGRMPRIPASAYPVTVRFLGFEEKTVAAPGSDTIFLAENTTELPELVVPTRKQVAAHILAYVREYSTLSTYTDSVFLFREKMVDFMLVLGQKSRFKGWSVPRVLKSRSYYRFADSSGLDSVSSECNQHFSWSDWIGLAPAPKLRPALRHGGFGVDTLRGRYSPSEVWIRKDDRLIVDVNVLADTASRRWVPNLSTFFRKNLDFETFKIRFNYDNVVADSVSPLDLRGYSYTVESNGRGHNMFRFNRVDEPFFVSTYAEVYVIDKEIISIKEARRWEKLDMSRIEGPAAIYEAAEAPPLQAAVVELVDRVNAIDSGEVRLGVAPDRRLAGRHVVRQHLGQRVLQLFKTITGISRIRANRNMKREWNEFRRDRMRENNDRYEGEK